MTTTQGSASQQTPTQSQVQVGTTPTATRRAMLGLGLGNTLEWYDWMIFGLLAALIGPQFFAAQDPVSATLDVLAVFAVGFVVRPLGGVLLGNVADRVGRRRVMLLSVTMMAVTTLVIGLLPTYETIGVWAGVASAGLPHPPGPLHRHRGAAVHRATRSSSCPPAMRAAPPATSASSSTSASCWPRWSASSPATSSATTRWPSGAGGSRSCSVRRIGLHRAVPAAGTARDADRGGEGGTSRRAPGAASASTGWACSRSSSSSVPRRPTTTPGTWACPAWPAAATARTRPRSSPSPRSSVSSCSSARLVTGAVADRVNLSRAFIVTRLAAVPGVFLMLLYAGPGMGTFAAVLIVGGVLLVANMTLYNVVSHLADAEVLPGDRDWPRIRHRRRRCSVAPRPTCWCGCRAATCCGSSPSTPPRCPSSASCLYLARPPRQRHLRRKVSTLMNTPDLSISHRPSRRAPSCDARTWSWSAAAPPASAPRSPRPAPASSVTLVERYSALGGLASGGMVLVLDDMVNGDEITVTGIVDEYVERMAARSLAVYPPVEDRATSTELWNKWGRYGTFNFHSHTNPKPICYAVAFDPDGWKRTSIDLVREAGVHLRMHSWFSRPIVDDGVMKGVVVETKAGPAGDPRRRGHRHHRRHRRRVPGRRRRTSHDNYLVTLVFRLGGVDTDAAETFEQENPKRGPGHQPHDQAAARRRLGAVVAQDPDPRRGLVQRPAHDRLRRRRPGVADQRRVRRPRPHRRGARGYPQRTCRASRTPTSLDVAQQMGVRQTRLLQGEYVVTKDDVAARAGTSPTRVARGRDYYTPYRSLLPEAWTSCWSPADTTRRPPRRRDVPRDPAVHGAWDRPPASPPRSPSRRRCTVRDVAGRARSRCGCATRVPTRATVPSANATIDHDRGRRDLR